MEVLNDFNTSVAKALEEIDPKWKSYEGLIIAGSWPGENNEEVVEMCRKKLNEAWKKDIPVLGICLGHQIIGLERGIKLNKLPERRVGLHFVEETQSYETFWHDYTVGYDYYENDKTISTQFHPEYQSSKDKLHPILVKFINLCNGSANGVRH